MENPGPRRLDELPVGDQVEVPGGAAPREGVGALCPFLQPCPTRLSRRGSHAVSLMIGQNGQ